MEKKHCHNSSVMFDFKIDLPVTLGLTFRFRFVFFCFSEKQNPLLCGDHANVHDYSSTGRLKMTIQISFAIRSMTAIKYSISMWIYMHGINFPLLLNGRF